MECGKLEMANRRDARNVRDEGQVVTYIVATASSPQSLVLVRYVLLYFDESE